MSIATITLLIANLVTVIGTGVYVGKEIDRLKKDTEHVELSVVMQTKAEAEKLGYDIAAMEKELKEQISKEFITIPYRHIR